jgi:ATP-dependent Lhr-like helicase
MNGTSCWALNAGYKWNLGLSRLKKRSSVDPSPPTLSEGKGRGGVLKIWGISATIGNLEQAAEVLLGNTFPPDQIKMVRAFVDKKLVIKSVIPENIESYSWTGTYRDKAAATGDGDCGPQ